MSVEEQQLVAKLAAALAAAQDQLTTVSQQLAAKDQQLAAKDRQLSAAEGAIDQELAAKDLGGITPHALLASTLPRVPQPVPQPQPQPRPQTQIQPQPQPSASAGSCGSHPLHPSALRPWEQVDPSDTTSMSLENAITEHQSSAVRIYGVTKLHEPRTEDDRSMDSQASLASRWDGAVADTLTDLGRKLPGGGGMYWMLQPPSDIIQDALQFTTQRCTPQPLPAGPEPSKSCRPLQAPVQQDTASQPSSWSKSKADFTLTLPAASAGLKRRCICVGGVKRAAKLLDGSGSPIDLRAAWGDPLHPLHARASAVISQLFTYMQFWKLRYGFVTCWFGTWLAYCPPHDRRTLYVSQPFLNSTAGPSPTARGAVAWLQATALACVAEEVDVHPAMHVDAVDLAGAGGTGGHAARSTSTGTTTSGDTSQPGHADARNGCKEHQPPHSENGNGSDGQQSGTHPELLSVQILHLSGKLREGSSVLAGTCQGLPAVVKLLGPDASGLAAFQRQARVYRLLQSVQGGAVPRLLAAGHLVADVYAIATACIPGVPLSSLATIPPPVAEAARRALERVHSAAPGLCHGDVRLRKIMLQDPVQEDRESSATCVVIDFGRACCGCSSRQQRDEVEHLVSLLKARSCIPRMP